ncbi:MAG TPA: hypothetical protein VH702_18705 [Vicinamibacterales bacterium]|jgi:hypothetical protein
MDIHFVSSLTDEDEQRVAAAIVAAAEKLLGHSPLSYSLRVRTAGGRVFETCRLNQPGTGHSSLSFEHPESWQSTT